MRVRAFKEIVLKELKLTLRKPAYMFWNIVFPIILLTLLVVLFAPKPSAPATAESIKVVVLPEERTPELVNYTRIVVKYLREEPGIDVSFSVGVFNGTLEDALSYLKNGTYDAVILVPKDAEEAMNKNLTIKATIYLLTGTPKPFKEQLTRALLVNFYNITGLFIATSTINWSASALVPYLEHAQLPEEALETLRWLKAGVNALGRNVDVKIVEVRPKMLKKASEIRPYVIGWMTISVVFMEFMFLGVLGVAISISTEFERRYAVRLLSAGVTPGEIYAGKIVAALALYSIPSVVLLLWGTFVLGAKFTHGLFSIETAEILVLMLTGTLLTMFMGILLGLLFKSTEAVSIAANALIWPTMMLGGFWIPKFMLPAEIRIFAEANPLSVLMYAVIEVSCYGRTLEPYLPAIATCLCLTLALAVISTILFKRRFSKMLER